MIDNQKFEVLYNDLVSLVGSREAMAVMRIIRLDCLHVSEKSEWADWSVEQQMSGLKALEKVLKGIPVQYVVSKAWFYGRPFYVNDAVLIPRPETEELVYHCMQKLKSNKPDAVILDIGAGSGCIGITLALELPDSSVSAIDVDSEALKVAAINANNLRANVRFVLQDILQDNLEPLGTFDLVVSNPPYISYPEAHLMSASTLEHEPSIALFVEGEDPLIFYHSILLKADQLLAGGGWLAFECNEFNADKVAEEVGKFPFYSIEVIKDMQGKKRMVFAQKMMAS